MPGVEPKASVREGRVVVALCGELDFTGAADAEAAIAALVARGQSLIIDRSALDFIDCSSLGALLRVQGLARRAGGEVVLAAPQRHALRLLTLAGKDDAFSVHASVAAAVACTASRRRRYSWRRLAVHAARPERAALSRTGGWPYRPGHGLWVVRQAADQMSIWRGPGGPVVTAAFALPAAEAPPAPADGEGC